MHIICRKPKTLALKSSPAKDIDTKTSSGYILLPPSNHISGRRYEWDLADTFDSLPTLLDLIPPVPNWAHADRADETRATDGPNEEEKTGLENEAFRNAVLSIPNDDLPYQEYLEVGMAIHCETEGSSEGLELFLEFSRRSAKHVENTTTRKWKTFGKPNRQGKRNRSGRHILALAKQHGWVEPDDDVLEGFQDLGDDPEAVTQRVKQSGDGRKEIIATPYRCADPKLLPRRAWLYSFAYVRRCLSVLISPGGVGKTGLLAAEAMAMATGQSLFEDEGPRVGPLHTWYINLEESKEELDRRFAAIRLHHGIKAEDINGRLFVDGRELELVIAQDEKSGFTICQPVVEAVKKAIGDNRIDVVIVDPFVSSHRISENDNMKIDAVAKTWVGIAEATNCSIMVAHHARKPGTGQTEMSANDSRGASALIDASRSARVINRMSARTAEDKKLEHPGRYFRVDDAKSNMGPPSDRAVWRYIASIRLGNRSDPMENDDDNVGVVTYWEMPDKKTALTDADVSRALRSVLTGAWRKDSQASDWIGKPLAAALGWDSEESENKKALKSLIAGWIKDGTFAVEMRKDAKSKDREFIVVNRPPHGPGEELI